MRIIKMKNAFARLWSFVWPFLVSQEPWSLKFQSNIFTPDTADGVIEAGRARLKLPELCKTWFIIACIGLSTFLDNYSSVKFNELSGAFYDAITTKDLAKFVQVIYPYLFMLVIGTVLQWTYEWFKQVLVLNFTMFTTKRMMRLYTLNRNFYPLSLRQQPDNPNERIQLDIADMCSNSTKIAFMVFDSAITLWLFGSIMWSNELGLDYQLPLFGARYHVHHPLLISLVVCVVVGYIGVIFVGGRLIGLQKEQKKLAANFRVGLVHLEKYAEPVAAYRGEEREYASLWHHFLLALFKKLQIVWWECNVGVFSGVYSQINSVIPYIVFAPAYFAGKVSYGTVTRCKGAFFRLLSAFTNFISVFDMLANLIASIERVSELREALENLDVTGVKGEGAIKREGGQLLEVEHVTLHTPDRSKLIVRDFQIRMAPGKHVAITGPSGSGKTSILRAIAGLPLWDRGEGTIKMADRPDDSLMLSQIVYLPSDASLREQLLYPAAENVSDDALLAVLQQVNLPDLAQRVGGLDSHYNWDSLSGGERQRLVVARALVRKPRLVIADEATAALDKDNEEALYKEMMDAGITMLSVTHNPGVARLHDTVVELTGDGIGGWRAG